MNINYVLILWIKIIILKNQIGEDNKKKINY